MKNEEDRFAEAVVGDEFILLLSVKGQVFSFGENFDNQLGASTDEIPFHQQPTKVQGIPLVKKIYGGRNHCFAVGGDNELIAWGSNRYQQISIHEDFPIVVKPRNAGFDLPKSGQLILSSYFTLLLTPSKFHIQQSSPEKVK